MSTHEPKEDAFGFGSIATSAKDRIRQIRPSAPPYSSGDLSKIDVVADNAGFVSREASVNEYVTRGSRLPRPEPRNALNMRVPVSLGNAFQRFCEENRYSYPEGLAEIMKRAGLSV